MLECLGLWGFDVKNNYKYRNAPSLTFVRCEACAQAIILNTNSPYLVLCTVRLPKKHWNFLNNEALIDRQFLTQI